MTLFTLRTRRWLWLFLLVLGVGWGTALTEAHASPLTGPDRQVPETVNLVIQAELVYDEPSNAYRVALSISDPVYVRNLLILVDDVEFGTQIIANRVPLQNQGSLLTQFSAEGLRDGSEYLLKISAEDAQGNLLVRNEQFSSGQDDLTIFATKQFKYNQPKLPDVTVDIQSVTPNYVQGVLTLIWEVSDPSRIEQFSGYIVDEGGQRIYDIPPTVFDPASSSFTVEIPPTIANARAESTYIINLNFETDNEQSVSIEQEFTPKPPPRPGLIRRVLSSFSASTNTLTAVLLIVLASMAWRMMQGDKKPKKQALKPPPIGHTRQYPTAQSTASPAKAPPAEEAWAMRVVPRRKAAPPPPPPPARLRIAVVESPSPAMTGMERIVESFPITIGRSESDIVLREDSQISRQHARILHENGRFYLMDLGSTNGTYINKQALKKEQRVPLSGTKRVWFGRNTECEIEVL